MLRFIKGTILLIAALILCVKTMAQEVITLSIPESWPTALLDSVLTRFENENPGIQVEIIILSNELTRPVDPTNDLDEHLFAMEALATSGDVIFVTPFNLTLEATRSGYFLNLGPLIDSDPMLNTGDFYPEVWQSTSWDNGVWMIPAFTDLILVSYDPEAFDEAGLPYPDASWTLNDLINVSNTLAIDDTQGLFIDEVNLPVLFASLNEQPFYTDFDGINIAQPNLAQLIELWATSTAQASIQTEFNSSTFEIPLRIGELFLLRSEGYVPALLPGGRVGLSVYGFAVSAGTSNPDSAYTLARFLATTPEIQQLFPDAISAQSNVLEDSGNFSQQVMGFLTSAVVEGIPMSEMLPHNYITQALQNMNSGNNPLLSLEDIQSEVTAQLDTLSVRTVTVATPQPSIEQNEREGITLNFAIVGVTSQLASASLWNDIARSFADADAEIQQINLNYTSLGLNVDPVAPIRQNDCFFVGYNPLEGGGDTSLYLPLDPLIDADPNFDRQDIMIGALQQLQRDGTTYGLPILIHPVLLRYHREQFEQAGVRFPVDGWNVTEFYDTLNTLFTGENPVFYPEDITGTYIFMLIAANDGLPIDYRTTPPTYAFTTPENVEAIRQILDLAKNGLIEYQPLAAFAFDSFPRNNVPALYVDIFQPGLHNMGGNPTDYNLTTFPDGTQFTPLSYTISSMGINAETQYPEACYRWISSLINRPEIINGMPAFRSLINDPTTLAAQGNNAIEVYTRIDNLAQSSNVVVINNPYFQSLWLKRAFDHYVLDDADLEMELTQAQQFVEDYEICVEDIDPTTINSIDFQNNPYVLCAVEVDPSIGALFGIPRE